MQQTPRFYKKTLKDMRNSITHNLPITGNFTLAKYLNLNVGINYRENWYFSYINKNITIFWKEK